MMNYAAVIAYVIARLKEGSSMAGLAAMLGALHWCNQCNTLAEMVMPVVISVLGLAAFLIKDKGA